MTTLERRIADQTRVTPHWLPGNESLWYLHKTPAGRPEFVFADGLNQVRRPAFDYENVVVELKRLTGIDIGQDELAFSWIELDTEQNDIRFQFDGKKWHCGPDGNVQEWDGEFTQKDPRFLDEEIPSVGGGDSITVNFVNLTTTTVSLTWISFAGEGIFYARIEAGASSRLGTYSGHVWRIAEESTGNVKAIYQAPNAGFDTVFISDARTNELSSLNQPRILAANDIATTEPDTIAAIEHVRAIDPAKKEVISLASHDVEDASSHPRETARAGREVYVSAHNLYLRDLDGSETPLTTDGSVNNAFDRGRIYISPTAQFVVAWQYVPEQEHIVYLVETSPSDQLQPKLQRHQYLKPGDRVRVDRPRLFHLDERREVSTDNSLFANPYYLRDIGWSKDGQEYRFIFNERGHQHLRVLAITQDGTVRVVVEESSNTFIHYSQKTWWRWLQDTDELLWASERSGYNHLYLVDMKGENSLRPITQGEWNVFEVETVDEEQRKMWIKAYGVLEGGEPYYAYLVRVNFDGSDFHVITDNNGGTHTWDWSPDRRYLLDSWSRVDCPPQTTLRNVDADRSVFLEGIDPETLVGEPEWTPPERFTAPGRDGETPIYGIIVRPANFDANKSYPVIEDIYAGPHDFFTPKAYSTSSGLRDWANQGYIMVKMDGMGTCWRSKAFHDVCYKNIKDGGLPDRIAWMKAAASTRPWMDISRVGIFGGSAGGQNAAAAVLHHGDFYKAAAADCGCHDNRMDKIWWNEQWMSWPVDQSYVDSSNATHVANLTGKLMLLCGELDTNVDPASTMQLVDALNKAGKDYELVWVPGGGHGVGGSGYPLRRQRDFFRRHLLSGSQ
ncbi:hypothetical protein B0I35DRAFT_446696 [Stachybotrys elegans]|uniref:Probable dipeptidyl-aminopeptidase B n=1 Tax=Stachybotrys elegans TaxID=80388 RepID=A0A8K0WK03_9HYPO|nr:hypothetical protein B0I35DRAFT_446696 [Stachybotrys elegans]